MDDRNADDRVFLDDLRAALELEGLILRGGFHPTPKDDAPAEVESLLLVGNAGPAMWRGFEKGRFGGPDPLNEWSRRVLNRIADRFGAAAIFPFDGPPYAPFLTWAKRAEPVRDSPVGMLIHPVYGLWHAWRGALAFKERLALTSAEDVPRPCDGCAAQPCLTTCPVGAFAGGVYNVAVCAEHLRTPEGSDCMAEGCRARRACPVGSDYVYEPAQAEFHMTAFLRNQTP